jgi:hypothetical protein
MPATTSRIKLLISLTLADVAGKALAILLRSLTTRMANCVPFCIAGEGTGGAGLAAVGVGLTCAGEGGRRHRLLAAEVSSQLERRPLGFLVGLFSLLARAWVMVSFHVRFIFSLEPDPPMVSCQRSRLTLCPHRISPYFLPNGYSSVLLAVFLFSFLSAIFAVMLHFVGSCTIKSLLPPAHWVGSGESRTMLCTAAGSH